MRGNEDTDLVQATIAGDTDAFTMLIEKYERPIYNLAYRITGSRDDAMDATQTAFTNAFENLDRFDDRHRFFSWLYRIAVNASLDLVKGRREVELPDQTLDTRPGPEERCGSHEIEERVQLALLRLSREHRVVIVLRHYLGLSYEEIAQATEVPLNTVRSRLYEARRRLEQILLPTWKEQ